MSSNTHESLIMARSHIEQALVEEREGTGASEAIIDHCAKAQEELNRAVLVQRAILSHRSGHDFPEGA